MASKKVEIVSPAGNLASIKAAIEAGADVVYTGLSGETSARNFEGLNFTPMELKEGAAFVRLRGKKLYLAINTFPQGDTIKTWDEAVDAAAALKADAVILADLGVLSRTRKRYPHMNIHLSVQASASNVEAIELYKRHFGIKRVVLPRVHTIEEIKRIAENTDVETEAFLLGGLCINIEGRCFLSSFITGASTNTEGACSPSRFVRFSTSKDGALSIRLNSTLLNTLSAGESSPYPTCCKGRYVNAEGERVYAMEEPESLNALPLLPELLVSGISALKIEGRQRTKSYVAEVTRIVREAVDAYYADGNNFRVKDEWIKKTNVLFEGAGATVNCYGGK